MVSAERGCSKLSVYQKWVPSLWEAWEHLALESDWELLSVLVPVMVAELRYAQQLQNTHPESIRLTMQNDCSFGVLYLDTRGFSVSIHPVKWLQGM